MKKKFLLLLVLSALAFASLTVGTLSSYTSVSSFSVSIYPDLHKTTH